MLCGQNNWIVITGDKKIESVPENRQAVIEAKAKVFLLNDSNSRPEVWAAAVLLGHYKMQEVIDANSGPFFVTVGKRSDHHVQRIRRPFGFSEPHYETVPRGNDEKPMPSQDPQGTVSAEGSNPSKASDAIAADLISSLS
jgi:hypothetical protein